MAIELPTVAWAKVKVGVPVRVQSSEPWTADSPATAGRVTCAVASVEASYCRFAAVKVPVTVSVRRLMFATAVAVVFHV